MHLIKIASREGSGRRQCSGTGGIAPSFSHVLLAREDSKAHVRQSKNILTPARRWTYVATHVLV